MPKCQELGGKLKGKTWRRETERRRHMVNNKFLFCFSKSIKKSERELKEQNLFILLKRIEEKMYIFLSLLPHFFSHSLARTHFNLFLSATTHYDFCVFHPLIFLHTQPHCIDMIFCFCAEKSKRDEEKKNWFVIFHICESTESERHE